MLVFQQFASLVKYAMKLMFAQGRMNITEFRL